MLNLQVHQTALSSFPVRKESYYPVNVGAGKAVKYARQTHLQTPARPPITTSQFPNKHHWLLFPLATAPAVHLPGAPPVPHCHCPVLPSTCHRVTQLCLARPQRSPPSAEQSHGA